MMGVGIGVGVPLAAPAAAPSDPEDPQAVRRVSSRLSIASTQKIRVFRSWF
jgi:hypothetical protein